MILLARITFSKRESRQRLNCTATKRASLNTLITHFLLALLISLFSPFNYTSGVTRRQESRGSAEGGAFCRGSGCPRKTLFSLFARLRRRHTKRENLLIAL